jgi:AcrR family transcriptional regulator
MRADVAAVEPEACEGPMADDAALHALARFRAVGLAYVDFARTQPGLFRTAYAPGVVLPEAHDPALPDHPQRVLAEVLDELVELGLLGPEQRRHGEVAAWASVHGIAVLLLDGVLGEAGNDPQPLIDAVLEMTGTGLCGPALFAGQPATPPA